MANSPFIADATLETFHSLVLERSQKVPVLVDFWADWCQPCQMLMPVLSKLADEYQGAFYLVKVNSDEQQQLAQQFGVRSLPTVKVFHNGEAVDEFMGVQPELTIRELINKYRVRDTEPLRQDALASYRSGDVDDAISKLNEVLQKEPDFHEAAIDLATLVLLKEDIDVAEQLINNIPEDMQETEQVQQILGNIKLARLQNEAGDVNELKQRLADNPDDVATMIELAKTYIALGEHESGMGLYLKSMQLDSSFNEEAARKGLLQAFELLSSADPLVKRYRNKLFSMLH